MGGGLYSEGEFSSLGGGVRSIAGGKNNCEDTKKQLQGCQIRSGIFFILFLSDILVAMVLLRLCGFHKTTNQFVTGAVLSEDRNRGLK